MERCLSCEELFKPGMLIDNHLTARQAQKLLHMICYSESEYYKNEVDQKSLIVRILEVIKSFFSLEALMKQDLLPQLISRLSFRTLINGL